MTRPKVLGETRDANEPGFDYRDVNRKKKRPLLGRSKIVMLNALCEMRMRMGNVNGIQCCHIPIYGTNQMRMAFSFAFGGGFGSHPDWPHSHLGKLGPNRPRPLCGDVVDEDEEAAEDEDEEVDDAEEGTRNSDIKTRLYSLVSKQQVKFNQFIKQSDSCSRFSVFVYSLCSFVHRSLFLGLIRPNWVRHYIHG